MGAAFKIALVVAVSALASRGLAACTPVSADELYSSRTTVSTASVSSGATAPEVASLPPRHYGPVWIYVTAAAVAPCTDGGETWDWFGSVPAEVRRGVQQGLSSVLRRTVLARVAGGASMATAVASVLPWMIGVVSDSTSPPDVYITVSRNGELVGSTGVVNNTFYPTWSQRIGPVLLGPTDQLDLRAADNDEDPPDHIGSCTVQGTPAVDAQGYVSPDAFVCHGQLWAVAVRLQPEEHHEASDN